MESTRSQLSARHGGVACLSVYLLPDPTTTFNPNAWKAEAGSSLVSSKPAWSTK